MPEHTPASLFLEGDIVLLPGARAHYIYFTKKTSSFDESGNITNSAGDYYQQQIKFKTPKDRPVLRHVIERCRNNRVCIVYQDRNGYFKMVRNLRVIPKTSSGTFQSYNGVSFTLTGKTAKTTGFWNYQPNDYIQPTITPVVTEPTTGPSDPGTFEDTNWVNTDLTFLENRIHNLENHVLSLIGTGKMILGGLDGPSKLTVLGGDIEAGESGFGLILKDDQGNRWRITMTHHGAFHVIAL